MTQRFFFYRFLAVAVPLLLILAALHYTDRRMEQARWQEEMAVAVASAARDLSRGFHEAAADTLVLAADRDLRAALTLGDAPTLAGRFIAMARYKPHYQQIRYIDADGMERLRVNAGSAGVVRVPDAELQNKAQRDYFREAVGLPDGAVRISRLDLNIEHGRIEEPFNPMLRFSSPVFDARGRQRGVIVINFGVGPLLARLEAPTGTESGRLMLLNTRGSWLAGGEPEARWGDMRGRGDGFATARPDAWRRIVAEADAPATTWEAAGYHYARATLRPADFVRAELERADIAVSSADAWWVVVSEVDAAAVAADPNARLVAGGAIAGIGLVLWAIAMLGVQRFKRTARDATQRARQLAQVVEQTSDVVFITDPEGHISYVNPAFSEVTGYSEAEAKAHTPSILKSGQHPDDFYVALWTRLKQGLSFRDLFINRRRDGTLFYEEKTISPLTDEDGRITSYVSTGKDITDSKVTRLAFYDQLTGLVNRSLFLDRLQNEIAHAGRTGQHIAVLYMDLDGFKAVNDTLGHDAGDAVLKEFALRVGALMRKSDTLARLGGDEFAALLKEVDGIAEAEAVAAKIVAAVMAPWRLGAQQPVVGVSIGISLFPSENVDSLNLLARADSAMYTAKRSGSNRYVVFSAGEKA